MSNEPTGARRYGTGGGDAYYDAVKYGGYQGTREKFGKDQAEFADNAAAVAEAKAVVEADTQEVRQKLAQFSDTTLPAAVQAVQGEGETQIQAVKAQGETSSQQVEAVGIQQKDAVADEGTTQVGRVQAVGDDTIAASQAAIAAAGAAEGSALVSEGYAEGKQNGSDVGSGSPYYHANAKYHAEQASGSATTAGQQASAASGSADTASAKALVAEGYAVGKQNGTNVDSESPYYHNNAKYYADEAADSATDAAASAASVSESAAQIATNTEDISNLKSEISDLSVEEEIQKWQKTYESTDETETAGLHTVTGYIRSTSGNYPGRINPSNGYKTCWFQATEEIQIYATCNTAFRLRVSDEEPEGGNSKAFTGTVYDSGDGTMPTAENPATVASGKYVAFSSNDKTGYTLDVYLLVDTTERVLASTIPLTSTMISEITGSLQTPLRNSCEVIPMTWGTGNFTITTGADIRGTLDGSTSRKSSSVISAAYPVAVGNDLSYRLRLSVADSDYKITSTGDFSEGAFSVIPANTPFRVTIRNDGDTDISGTTDATINEHVHFYALFPNGYAPVKWCAMGDSITQGWYSEMSGDTAVNHSDTSKVWASKVAIINGWQITNIARGSTGWLDPVEAGDYTTAGFYIARHTDFSGYDLVTLAYGVNDWKANRTAGSYEDDPVADETPTTVMQAMRATIEAIMASNPSCKIIVILPLNCVGYSYNYGDKSTNYGLGYSFSNSGTLESFVEKMIEVCDYYGIQYIDQTHYSVINRENLLTMLPDGVHPSLRAHTLLANELAKKITF